MRKMKHMKKFLALSVSLLMVISMMPIVSAAAEDDGDSALSSDIIVSEVGETVFEANRILKTHYLSEDNVTITDYDAVNMREGVSGWVSASTGAYVYGAEDGTYTNNDILYYNAGATDIDSNNEYRHYWEAIVEIPADGKYVVTIGAPAPVEYESQGVKATIDDTVIFENTTQVKSSATPAEKRAVVENAKVVQLTKGQHTLRFYTRRGAQANNILLLDYVKIASDATPISATEETHIEADTNPVIYYETTNGLQSDPKVNMYSGTPDFSTNAYNAYFKTNASGGKHLYYNAYDLSATSVYWEKDVLVTKAGSYNVTVAVAGPVSNQSQHYVAMVDNQIIYESNTATNATTFTEYSAKINLTTGLHKIKIANNGGQLGNKNNTLYVDYVDFAPDALVISGTEAVYAEGEDYPDVLVYDKEGKYTKTLTYGAERKSEDEKAHGGVFYRAHASEDTEDNAFAAIEIPVIVKNDGVYDVSLTAHIPDQYTGSDVHLLLDGERVLTLGTEQNTGITGPDNVAAKMNKTTVQIKLTEGAHTFTYKSANAIYNQNLYMWWDCLEVKPFEMKDSATVSETGTTVVGCYETPVTGLALAAIYVNDELINVETRDVTNAYKVEINVPAETTPTKVKMFIWSDLETITPLVVSKDITNIQ